MKLTINCIQHNFPFNTKHPKNVFDSFFWTMFQPWKYRFIFNIYIFFGVILISGQKSSIFISHEKSISYFFNVILLYFMRHLHGQGNVHCVAHIIIMFLMHIILHTHTHILLLLLMVWSHSKFSHYFKQMRYPISYIEYISLFIDIVLIWIIYHIASHTFI